MGDLSHLHGNDLKISASGDLEVSASSTLTQQRVIRRLLTNAFDDAWNPRYGAGLPQMVGQVAVEMPIAGLIRSQMLLETAVAASPMPSVTVGLGSDGLLIADIRYADASNGAFVSAIVPLGVA